jgi:AcrR family transcriptional regulator
MLRDKNLTQSQRKERTRVLLLAAAGQVFVNHGFNGASIDLIAQSAGYTKGAVYFHFKDKQELLFGVIQYRSQLLYDAMHKTKKGDDLLNVVLDEGVQKEIIGQWFDREKWVVLLLEYLLYMQRNPAIKEQFLQLLKADRERLITLIKAKYREGKKPLPMPAADMAAIQEIVDIGFGVSRLIDPSLSQSLYEKLLSVAR